MPAAEIDVTADLARGLLEAQYPDLATLPLRVVANGWDNVVIRLGDDLALRLPRRGLGAALIAHEQRWLPELGPRLPVAVPVPVRVGAPSDGTRGPVYPWSWSVVRWLPGRVAYDVTVAERGGMADGLAAFVSALHRPAPPQAPVSSFRGVPLAARDDGVRRQLAQHPLPASEELVELWGRLVATAEWPGPPLWLHGDLHPANLLAGAGPDGPILSAVIDFGDVTAGDPATDLATAWLTFDRGGRERFRAAVGHADPDTWQRARGWALAFGVLLATGSADAPHLKAVGEHTLAQVLADEDPPAR